MVYGRQDVAETILVSTYAGQPDLPERTVLTRQELSELLGLVKAVLDATSADEPVRIYTEGIGVILARAAHRASGDEW